MNFDLNFKMLDSSTDDDIFITQSSFRNNLDQSYDTDCAVDAVLFLENLRNDSDDELINATQRMENEIEETATRSNGRFKAALTEKEVEDIGEKR